MAFHPRYVNMKLNVRPKCVQSTRFGRGHTFVSKEVKLWKAAVLRELQPYIPAHPCTGPVRILNLQYCFKLPTTPSAAVDDLCALFTQVNGQVVEGKSRKARLEKLNELIATGKYRLPYLAKADLKDNLNKGLMDCLTGRFFVDDSQIWEDMHSAKVYSTEDCIRITLELT